MESGQNELVIADDLAGSRLDAAIKKLCDLPVRARRRLIEDGRVLVNGRRSRAGQMVTARDVVRLLESGSANAPVPVCRLLSEDRDYAFFEKPRGLHTVTLQGRDNFAVDNAARTLLTEDSDYFQLLQRLDFQTSGIVAAALNAEAEARFRLAEKDGAVLKKYVCLLEGTCVKPVQIRARLVSDGAKGMRALPDEDPDPARWTRFVPLAAAKAAYIFPGTACTGPLTLAGVELHRGARHQIRVHAASLGLPLAGDTLYGGHALPAGHFFLHHGLLRFGDRVVADMPVWPGLEYFAPSVRDWLSADV